MDFPTWFGLGSYGGLLCSFLAAAGIASYALVRRRGTPRQLARTILVCLVASCLMLVSAWWNQNRLDLYGPSLPLSEVLFWLGWTALAGWLIPLSAFAGYLALSGPQAAPMMSAGNAGIALGRDAEAFIAPDDPARTIEPLGAGRAWGQLVPLDGLNADQPLPLSRKLVLLGRELDNDIVTDDERTSRHHAELHWDHGHVHLRDRASMNGTRVNRQVARGPTPLKTGDVIELGAQRYRVELLTGPLSTKEGVDAEETRKVPSAGRDAQEAEPPLPALALVALMGDLAGQRWALDAPLASVGREQGRDICLPDESVSRLHAQIVRQRAGYFISDLHSRNGTTINGQPLTAPTLLLPGDVVHFGEIELRCEAEPQAAQEAVMIASATVTPPTIPLHPRNRSSAPTDGPAPEAAAFAMRIASKPYDRERPRLGPPRLTPSQPAPGALDAAE